MIHRLWRWLPYWIGLLFFLLYVTTAAPSISELFTDSLEFQLTPPTFGIAHMTGYPLYTLLGGVWSRLLFPIGNWAWRMNIFSAVAAALSLALLFALAQRLFGDDEKPASGWPGIAAVLCFGLGTVWWQQATIAEVYALHNLFVVVILLTTVHLASLGSTQTARSEQAHSRFGKQFSLLFLWLGLSLTHHRTTLLLLPDIAIYLLLTVPALYRPRREWWLWLVAGLLPLLLYLYIPLRAAMGAVDLNASYENTLQGFWNHILARGYGGFLSSNPLSVLRSVGDWLTILRNEMGWPGLALATLGALSPALPSGKVQFLPGRLTQPTAKVFILITLVSLTNLLFAVNYNVADVEVFLLPVFLCLSLFVAAGVNQLDQWGKSLRTPIAPAHAALPILACLLLLLGWGKQNWPVNRSQDWTLHDYAVAMAALDFPAGSQVIGLEGEMTAFKYMQQAVGLGTNAAAIVANNEEARRQAVADGVAAGKAIYLTREVPGIERLYSFSGDGPLVRVWPLGAAQVGDPQVPLDVWLAENRLHLIGYDLLHLAQAGGNAWRLALYWRPAAPLLHIYKVSLRWLDQAGVEIPQPDGSPGFDDYPLRQVALTPSWPVNQTVLDVYDLPLNPQVDRQADALLVILYDAETGAEAGRWQVALPTR